MEGLGPASADARRTVHPRPNDPLSMLARADQMIESAHASHSRPAPASGVESEGTADEATVAVRRGPPNDACCIWTLSSTMYA